MPSGDWPAWRGAGFHHWCRWAIVGGGGQSWAIVGPGGSCATPSLAWSPVNQAPQTPATLLSAKYLLLRLDWDVLRSAWLVFVKRKAAKQSSKLVCLIIWTIHTALQFQSISVQVPPGQLFEVAGISPLCGESGCRWWSQGGRLGKSLGGH